MIRDRQPHAHSTTAPPVHARMGGRRSWPDPHDMCIFSHYPWHTAGKPGDDSTPSSIALRSPRRSREHAQSYACGPVPRLAGPRRKTNPPRPFTQPGGSRSIVHTQHAPHHDPRIEDQGQRTLHATWPQRPQERPTEVCRSAATARCRHPGRYAHPRTQTAPPHRGVNPFGT